MNNQSLISVIINFLNEERFIEEAISSVFNQTYKNWELLLVDDGSTDRSTEIAKSYAQKYPDQIRYLEHQGHENRGSSAARNLGADYAQGEYIAFLDADDIWLPNNLELYINILKAQPQAGLVYGNTQKWYSWTDQPEDQQQDHLYELGIDTEILVTPPVLLNLLIEQKISAPCTCSLMIPRKILEEVGGWEESFRGMYDDQALYAKIFLKYPTFVTGAWGARYRRHANSCIHVARRTGQQKPSHLFFLNWLKQYLLAQKITDENIWQSLQKAFWPYEHRVLHQLKQNSFTLGRLILPQSWRQTLWSKWQEYHNHSPEKE